MLRRAVCVLLFVAWTAESPSDHGLYSGYWRSPFELLGPLFVSLPGINLFAWQVLLLALTPLCLFRPGSFHKHAWPLNWAILASVASVVLTLLWGLLRGGSAYESYYQLWRFLAGLLVGALLLSVIRTPRDLKGLGFTVLAAALVRGSLAIYFYLAHVRGQIEPPPAHMTTHDDSLLFVTGLLIALNWAVARRRWGAWLGAVLSCSLLIYAITLNNRRLAWIELVLSLVLVFLMLPEGALRRRARWLLFLGAPAVLAYVSIGWGREGALFAPIHALSTSGSYEDNSSLARLEENRNLIYTFVTYGNPLFGTGWGHQYEKLTSQYANYGTEWTQYRFQPHNSLLGMIVFSGLIGLFGIWLVIPVGAFAATRGYRGATRPVERAAAMTALCALPAYAIQCYGDIGFESLTCALILSAALGASGMTAAWAEAAAAGVARGARRI